MESHAIPEILNLLSLPRDIWQQLLQRHLPQDDWWAIAATCKLLREYVGEFCLELVVRRPVTSLNKVQRIFPRLMCLRIAPMFAKELRDIRALSALSRLRDLDLTDCKYIVPQESLCALQTLTNLKVLRLAQARASDETLESVLSLAPTLTELNIRACDMVSSQGFRHIARLTSLLILNLSNTALCDMDLAELCRSLPRLSTLDVRQCFLLTEKALEHVAELQCLESLRIKRMRTMDPQIPLASRVARLNSLARLHTLQLSSMDRLYNDGVDALSGSALPGLKHLDLSFCRSLNDLSPLSVCHGLQHLDLNHCTAVNDSCLTAIAALTQITFLDLRECSHSTAGLRTLSTLVSLRMLVTGPGHHKAASFLNSVLEHCVITVGPPYQSALYAAMVDQ